MCLEVGLGLGMGWTDRHTHTHNTYTWKEQWTNQKAHKSKVLHHGPENSVGCPPGAKDKTAGVHQGASLAIAYKK